MSKYNRTYHFPYSPGATNDDRIATSVERLIGNSIIISEKLDGENNGMTNRGLYARSHATFTTSEWSEEVRRIQSLIGRDIPDDVFLFGEGMAGIHSIEYKNLESYYYLFAVKDQDIWLSWDGVEEYAYLLDLKTVPVLFKGIVNSEKELKELVLDLANKESALGGEREGVVVRVANEFHDDLFNESVLKYVRKGHVRTDEHWTKNWKKAKLKNRLY